jgi:hypothetical protein
MGSLTFGLNATTPGLHLLGQGTAAIDTAVTGFDLDGDGIADELLTVNQQREIKARYHSPLSVGAGLGYVMGGTTLHLSAEWFDGVDRYQVLDTKPFVSQSSGVLTPLLISDEAKSVLDFGAGVAQKFRENFSGYAGFSVDRSPRVPETSLSIGAWDINNISMGTEFRLGKTDLLLGVVYSFGRESVRQVADLEEASGAIAAGETVPSAEVQFRRLRAVFGFTYGSAR